MRESSTRRDLVLEAVSQVEFPPNDGLCTWFVMGVALRQLHDIVGAGEIASVRFIEFRQAKLNGFGKPGRC